MHTFRRGTRRGTIRCLSFDITGRYLCVGSASGTIHFYKNTNGNGATNGNDGNNELSMGNNMNNNNNNNNNRHMNNNNSNSRTGFISSYISSFMPENLNTTKSFAQVRLRKFKYSCIYYFYLLYIFIDIISIIKTNTLIYRCIL